MSFCAKMQSAKADKNEERRRAEIARILANVEDPGRDGKAFEIACARCLSTKVTVSPQGKADVSIRMLRNGKPTYFSAECKTNGGRVTTLLDGTNKAKFVLYRLRFIQKHKAGKTVGYREELREIPAVIIPTKLFINLLEECGALKGVNHNGVQDGIAIQPSNKKMFLRLQEYVENYGNAVVFDREAEYDLAEFADLEL